jgi:tetratricopeptide (TPR) repeat protein
VNLETLSSRVSAAIAISNSFSQGEAIALFDEIGAALASSASLPPGQRGRLFEVSLRALVDLPADLITHSRIDGLLACAQDLFLRGRQMAGVEPCAVAVALARRLGDRKVLRKALTFHGVLLAELGNVATALERYEEALGIAESLQDPSVVGLLWVNISGALGSAGQFGESLAALELALSLVASDKRSPAFVLAAHTNIAKSAFHLKDYAKGLRSVRAAIEGQPEPSSQEDAVTRVLAEWIYTQLLLAVDDLPRARSALRSMRRLPRGYARFTPAWPMWAFRGSPRRSIAHD